MASWSLYDNIAGTYGTTYSLLRFAVGDTSLFFCAFTTGPVVSQIYRWDEDKTVTSIRGPDAGVTYYLVLFQHELYSISINPVSGDWDIDHYDNPGWSTVKTVTGHKAVDGYGAFFGADNTIFFVGFQKNGAASYEVRTLDGSTWVEGNLPYGQATSNGAFSTDEYQNISRVTFTKQFSDASPGRTLSQLYRISSSGWDAYGLPADWLGPPLYTNKIANYQDVWRYDETNSVWEWGTDFLTWFALVDPAMIPLPVIGSKDTIGSKTTNLYMFDQATGTWTLETCGHGNQVDLIFSLANDSYALELGPGTTDFKIYIRDTRLPRSELRLIDMALDSTNLYVTGNDGGTLKMYVYDLSSHILTREVQAGAATYAELDARTRGIFPVAKPGEDIIFVRGRDGNDLQAQMTDDYGVTLTNLSAGGWAAAKYATALMPDPLIPDDIVVVFDDNDIYRSADAGGAWAKTADAPVIQREAARDRFNPGNLILAGQVAGAGELHFTPNYGATTLDVSDAGLGLINHLEQSL